MCKWKHTKKKINTKCTSRSKEKQISQWNTQGYAETIDY